MTSITWRCYFNKCPFFWENAIGNEEKDDWCCVGARHPIPKGVKSQWHYDRQYASRVLQYKRLVLGAERQTLNSGKWLGTRYPGTPTDMSVWKEVDIACPSSDRVLLWREKGWTQQFKMQFISYHWQETWNINYLIFQKTPIGKCRKVQVHEQAQTPDAQPGII